MPNRPTVTRRKVLQGAAAVAVASALPRAAFASTANATLTVTKTTGPQVPQNFLGLSTDKSYLFQKCTIDNTAVQCFSSGNKGMVQMYQLLAAKYTNTTPFQPVLRFGANGVDLCNWNSLGINATYQNQALEIPEGTYNTLPSYVDDLAGFLSATGWLCLYGVNFANENASVTPHASAGEDNQTSALEVQYVAGALGSSLMGIEIGNEPDDYKPNGVFAASDPTGSWILPTPTAYFHRWSDYLYAILEKTPGVTVTATAAGGSGHMSAWNEAFLSTNDPNPLLPGTFRNQIQMITQHYYRGDASNIDGNGTAASCQSLCSDDPQFRAEYQDAYNFEYNGEEVTGLAYWAGTKPWRISECNSYYGTAKTGVLCSFASALWALDLCMSAATLGSQGINLHGNGQGLDYQPIQDLSGKVLAALPSFYGLLFFAMSGVGTITATNFNGTLPTVPGSNPAQTVNVSSYAVLNRSGTQLSVIINNKDVVNLIVTVNLSGFTPTSAGKYELTAPKGITQAPTPGEYNPFVTINGTSVMVSTAGDSVTFAPGTPDTNGVTISGDNVTTEVYAAGAVLLVIDVS